MQPTMVIGCNSLQLTPIGIQVLDPSGTPPIAWSDVTAAALAGKDRHMMQMYEETAVESEATGTLRPAGIPGPGMPGADLYAEQMKMLKLHQTHDPLLIVHRAGIVLALIERSGPERDVLLGGLRANLGKRWLGEDFTSQQLKQRFDPESSGISLRTCWLVTSLFGWAVLLMIGSLVAVAIAAVPGAAVAAFLTGFLDALFHRDWKDALLFGVAVVLIVPVCLGVKKVAGYFTTMRRGRFR